MTITVELAANSGVHQGLIDQVIDEGSFAEVRIKAMQLIWDPDVKRVELETRSDCGYSVQEVLEYAKQQLEQDGYPVTRIEVSRGPRRRVWEA